MVSLALPDGPRALRAHLAHASVIKFSVHVRHTSVLATIFGHPNRTATLSPGTIEAPLLLILRDLLPLRIFNTGTCAQRCKNHCVTHLDDVTFGLLASASPSHGDGSGGDCRVGLVRRSEGIVCTVSMQSQAGEQATEVQSTVLGNRARHRKDSGRIRMDRQPSLSFFWGY